MTSAGYRAWLAAGKPFTLAAPIAELARVLRGHGYTVGTIGNNAHLTASTPEDHCPFSATGWPSTSPRWLVMALDIMPGGAVGLDQLGAQLVADRNAGVPGVAWVKYINWTPAGQPCRHETWQPDHAVRASSDVGHIHVSARTDFARTEAATGYDPVARLQGGIVPVVFHPTKPAGTGARTLRLTSPYMHGDDVAFVQRWIGKARCGAPDGVYGPHTEKGVRWYQRLRGIAVDGICGPQTWHQMGVG